MRFHTSLHPAKGFACALEAVLLAIKLPVLSESTFALGSRARVEPENLKSYIHAS